MKSKTSLFNRTIIVNLLQRYWIAFALYFFVLCSVILIPLLNSLQEAGWYPSRVPYHASLLQLMGYLNWIIIVNFIAVAAAAALLFSYLYNARHTGMMASLPVKRETMYCSVSAAAIGGMLLCNAIVLALAAVIEVIYGQVHLGALGMLLGISFGTILAFFGLAAFCCMLTGNIFAGPAVYLIFNFLSLGVEMLTAYLLESIVFGFNSYDPKTMFLSPIMQVGNSVRFDYEMIRNAAGEWVDYTWQLEGMGVLAIYVLVGLVFLYLGMLLYKHRRMETAGDTIAIEILKPVFRFCMTAGGGILFAYFISQLLYEVTPTSTMAAAYIAVLLIIGGILGYFVGQMLITKSINVFRSGWRSILIYALCVIALIGAIEADLFGYERHVPNASDVVEVTIGSFDGNTVTLEEPENIEAMLKLHRNIICNKDFHEWEEGSPDEVVYMSQFDEPAAAFHKQTIRIIYTLQDESTVIRRYSLSYGPDEIRNSHSEIRALETLLNTPEAIASRYTVDYPVTTGVNISVWIDYVDAKTYENLHFGDLSPSEMMRLYNDCILPDIADGKLGVIDIVEDLDYAKSKYNCTIAFDISQKVEDGMYTGYHSFGIYPMLESGRTMAFLKEYGIEPAVIYDSMTASGYDYNDLGRYKVDGTDDSIDYAKYRETASSYPRAVDQPVPEITVVTG